MTSSVRTRTGVRPPVWSIALRIVAVVGVLAAGLTLLSDVGDGLRATDPRALWLRIIGGAGLSAIVLVLIASLSRWVEHRPPAESGLGSMRSGVRAFVIGAVAWLFPAAAAFGILTLVGSPLTITAPAAEFWTILTLLLVAVLLSEAVPEEFVFRGYVTRVLGERMRGWSIIVAQAAVFTLTATVLGGAVDVLGLSLFAAMGIGLGYMRLITGSVWTSIGFHTAFQTASQLVLTHNVVTFTGTPLTTTFALGAIPFAIGTTIIAVLVSQRPALFGRRD